MTVAKNLTGRKEAIKSQGRRSVKRSKDLRGPQASIKVHRLVIFP